MPPSSRPLTGSRRGRCARSAPNTSAASNPSSASPSATRLLLDKNPANTFDVPAIARIFPENKFLCALRDPRDTCLSCFMQPVNILPDTAAWLTLEGTIEHYAHIMGLWAAWKPCLADLAIEVRYEDLVDNLESSARRVLDFLGLAWDPRVLRFHEHASSKIVRSPTFAEVTSPSIAPPSAAGRTTRNTSSPTCPSSPPCSVPSGMNEPALPLQPRRVPSP